MSVVEYRQTNSARKRIVVVLKCEICKTNFERPHYASGGIDAIHFCSKECKKIGYRKGQPLREKMKSTLLREYGVEEPTLIPHVRESCISENAKENRKATWIELYGVDHPFKLPEIVEKSQTTFLKNHGVRTPFEIASVLERAIKATSSVVAAQKRKETVQRDYGVDCILQLPTTIKMGHTPEVNARRFQTLLETQPIHSSKDEEKFYEFLLKHFEVVDIQRSVVVNGRWPIDFYIKPTNCYVQFDGVYWHGLDRPILEIEQSSSLRDKKILQKWKTDQSQNDWFAKKILKLVRITDVEFNHQPDKSVFLERFCA